MFTLGGHGTGNGKAPGNGEKNLGIGDFSMPEPGQRIARPRPPVDHGNSRNSGKPWLFSQYVCQKLLEAIYSTS